MDNQISATEINALRQQTGAGMMDCRKALIESNGEMEKAIDYLRKKGQKVASARSDREAKEGVIVALTNNANTIGVVLCLACETDFVAKNEAFVIFAKKIAQYALDNKIANIEQLKNSKMGATILSDQLNEQVAKIGEKIDITKYYLAESTGVVSYIHGANRIGVLVLLNKNVDDIVAQVGKDVAMQIAAMNPIAIDEQMIAKETVEREKNIIIDQMKADPKMAGKPNEMIEKIATGKLNAFFKENTLLAQTFVKDSSKSVGDYISSASQNMKVLDFKRLNLG